ncbi:MAG: tetratricopeptide repeat protein [Beijerinckiaceae bacterium]|nr:tetratricopeptide repeat protein [Beijerinckiaceae bacterium]
MTSRNDRPFPGILLAIALVLAAGPVRAVDVHADPGPPSADLAPARALIKEKQFPQAIEALLILERTNQTADLYNLLAFSLRNLGEYERSGETYRRALALDPDHRSALEYQGELFIKLGQIERAEENMRRLEALCPQGCEERDDLAEALRAARGK